MNRQPRRPKSIDDDRYKRTTSELRLSLALRFSSHKPSVVSQKPEIKIQATMESLELSPVSECSVVQENIMRKYGFLSM